MKEDYKKLAIETLIALKMQVWKTEQLLKKTNKQIGVRK